MWKRKRPPKPSASTLALGKICGCGKCRYCLALQHEEMLLDMVDQVRRGKQIAESAREEILRNLKEKSDETGVG